MSNKQTIKFNDEQKNKFIDNAYTLRRELIQKMLDDTRDIDLECGYPGTISVADYEATFIRNGIGTRVIKLWPDECWNVAPDITEGEKTEESVFDKTWETLNKQFHFNDYLYRVDILSGIGRYGVLLLGINDSKTLDTPVEKGKHDIIFLKPLSESIVEIAEKETNVTNPRYGLPNFYTIKTEAIDGELSAGTTRLHHSRVLHIADNRGVSEIFGTPRLEPVYNYLLDLKKLLGGSSEMFWKGGFPGYAFEVNPTRTTALTPTEKTELRTEFLNFSNKLQRYIALTGVTAKSLEMQVADPSSHFMTQIKAIGIALGIPYRKLLGTEESKLAGAEDTKTWNRRIVKRQTEYCTPRIVRPFVDRLIEYEMLPKVEYEVKWPSLDELDSKDAAVVAKDKVEAIAKYVAAGADGLMPPHKFFTMIMGYTDAEAKEIIDAAGIWMKDTIDEGGNGEEGDE